MIHRIKLLSRSPANKKYELEFTSKSPIATPLVGEKIYFEEKPSEDFIVSFLVTHRNFKFFKPNKDTGEFIWETQLHGDFIKEGYT